MPIFKFRVALEQDDTIFRDCELKHTHTFFDFHQIILKAFNFDGKHQASFYKSNDNWKRNDEVSLNKKDDLPTMEKLPIAAFIDDPHQKIIYLYDPEMEWEFYVELMGVIDEKPKTDYPRIARTEGLAPKQYGNQPIPEKESDLFEADEVYELGEADEMIDDEDGSTISKKTLDNRDDDDDDSGDFIDDEFDESSEDDLSSGKDEEY